MRLFYFYAMQKTILITGATSGIGLATATLLAQHQFKLIITARNEKKLNEIAQKLAKFTSVITACFDVSDRKATEFALHHIAEKYTIDGLINNAGNAYGLEPVHLGNAEHWDKMMDINVKGLLNVSKCVIPQMVKNKNGHIINVGSLAGYEVYANGTVYCASKHAVKAITEGLRKELNEFGVKVSSINPGLVETNFSMVRFAGDEEKAKKVYQGFSPLQANDIAETILFMLQRPQHVNMAEVLILPLAQASSAQVKKSLFK